MSSAEDQDGGGVRWSGCQEDGTSLPVQCLSKGGLREIGTKSSKLWWSSRVMLRMVLLTWGLSRNMTVNIGCSCVSRWSPPHLQRGHRNTFRQPHYYHAFHLGPREWWQDWRNVFLVYSWRIREAGRRRQIQWDSSSQNFSRVQDQWIYWDNILSLPERISSVFRYRNKIRYNDSLLRFPILTIPTRHS